MTSCIKKFISQKDWQSTLGSASHIQRGHKPVATAGEEGERQLNITQLSHFQNRQQHEAFRREQLKATHMIPLDHGGDTRLHGTADERLETFFRSAARVQVDKLKSLSFVINKL